MPRGRKTDDALDVVEVVAVVVVVVVVVPSRAVMVYVYGGLQQTPTLAMPLLAAADATVRCGGGRPVLGTDRLKARRASRVSRVWAGCACDSTSRRATATHRVTWRY